MVKRILFLHAGAELYGADRILINLVSDLNKEKYFPIVVLPTDGPLVDELRKRHVETHIISYPILRRKYFNVRGMFSYIKNYKSGSKKIIELVKNNNIDVIHVNTLAVLEGIYLKKTLHAKLVWHVHEIITHPKIAYYLTAMLTGKFADEIVTVSENVKQHLVASRMVPKSKVTVIYNGIDTDKFKPHNISKGLYSEFSVESNDVVIGMIGRINAWKGQMALLNAMIPLMLKNKNLKLIFVGGVFKGEEHFRSDLKAAIKNSNVSKQISLKEFRTDMIDVYQLIDVFCLPSTNPDPLPTVVLEAMSSGKPIVGFEHGGIQEMVVQNKNGILVEPNNINSLTRAIEKLVENEPLRIEMGEQSRNRAIYDFSPKKFIEKFEKIYG